MQKHYWPLFNGIAIDPASPVIHWENQEPIYVMPHKDAKYGEHQGSEVDRNKNGAILYTTVELP